MGSMTIRGEAGGLISSVRMEEFTGPHGRVTVWNRGANAGTLTVDKNDAVRVAARLIGPKGDPDAGSVLERCVSLVQSLAKSGYPESRDQVDTFIDEAYGIAKDAGWT